MIIAVKDGRVGVVPVVSSSDSMPLELPCRGRWADGRLGDAQNGTLFRLQRGRGGLEDGIGVCRGGQACELLATITLPRVVHKEHLRAHYVRLTQCD